ncbi:HlyD family secretion protein [Acinetobacter baumannii]|uniref:HlyD family secretion protein n=1 Tax=Acinetobacter baumannii TaxID=470 RepID=UPI00112CB135|nr:HlyD family secretion protein [Acinetobacter baumannii]TPS59934.1 HlyD family secretion protein [Acinetobacter baumannii]
MSNKLFREEVFNEMKNKWIGEIILLRPLSFTFYTVFSLLIIILIVVYFIYGSYTKRSTVQGQLVPSNGLVKVYSTDAGIILKKYIKEGQNVKKGDILYEISLERMDKQGDVQDAISSQVQLRNLSLKNELIQVQTSQHNEKLEIQNKINTYTTDLVKINNLIESQKKRVNIAENILSRYKPLLQNDSITFEQYQQKQDIFLEQDSKLQDLVRNKNSILSDLKQQKIIMNGLDAKQDQYLERLNRDIALTNQELTESQSKKNLIIKASSSGIATAVNVQEGQYINTSTILLSIIPKNSNLIAEFYVPSNMIGFIKIGDKVLLRYEAYPYQKFGHADGKISSVSKASLLSSDLPNISAIFPQQTSIYIVKAKLEKQSIMTYGNQQQLQVGMTFEADILQETRSLYEWVFEPLISISGKL